MTFTELRFTRLVLRDCQEWPGLGENDVRYWRAQADTREEAEILIADRLFRFVRRRYMDLVDDLALWRVIRWSLAQVNWRWVACKMLDQFAPEPWPFGRLPAPSIN